MTSPDTLFLWPGLSLASAVAQELARQRSRWLPILEGHLTVHHNPAVPFSHRNPPPLTAGQVMGNRRRKHLQLVQIVHLYVGRRTLAEKAPVLEPSDVGR